jgi:hypothetical protein
MVGLHQQVKLLVAVKVTSTDICTSRVARILEGYTSRDTKLPIPFLIKLDIFVTINTNVGACGSIVVKRPNEVN